MMNGMACRAWRSIATLGLMGLVLRPPAAAQDIHGEVASGDTSSVAALLDSDATLLEARDASGRTPLLTAVLGRDEDMVRLLLDRGADPEAADARSGLRAVDYAFQLECQRGGTSLTRLLLTRGAAFDANGAVRGNVRRLDLAVVLGNVEMVRLLLESGADPNAATGYPRKPLASAAARGHAQIAELLISAGADPDGIDADGDPPLRLAVEAGHADVVRVLLAANCDRGFVDPTTGMSLLHLAVVRGHLPVVELLLGAGARVGAVDREGRAPLFYARRYGHVTVADRLLAAGADPALSVGGAKASSALLRAPVEEGGCVVWYLAGRGWAVRTARRLLVFDAEEFGVTRPTDPSLANGFLSAAELGDMDVVAIYTAYHGEPGDPAYVHQMEDSVRSITYVQNADDRWRGSSRSEYLSPHADTLVAGARIRTVEVTREMPSLGYLIEVDGVVVYFAGFRAEDVATFDPEVDALSRWVDRVDVAFLPIPEPGEAPGEMRRVVERLRPRFVALQDPNRRTELYPGVVDLVGEWDPDARVLAPKYPGDAFAVPGRPDEG